MNIGGFLPNSLLDYPEKVCCVVFTQGCNFHCPYCHNPDLVPLTPSAADPQAMDRILAFLERRRGLLDAVVVTGGEPTLQKGLITFLSRAKKMGFLVKLDTNGSRPQALRSILSEGLVDFVAMDIKTPPVHYSPLIATDFDPARLEASIEVIMASAPDYEFRTTCVRPFISPEAIDVIMGLTRGARRFALQRVRCDHVLEPDFFNQPDRNPAALDMEALLALVRPHVATCLIR